MGHPEMKRRNQHNAFLTFDNSEEQKWIVIIDINIELFFGRNCSRFYYVLLQAESTSITFKLCKPRKEN